MRDYTYINAESNEILLVCVAVKDVCEADYQFKDVIGRWPWAYKHVYTKSETSCLKPHDDRYIPEE